MGRSKAGRVPFGNTRVREGNLLRGENKEPIRELKRWRTRNEGADGEACVLHVTLQFPFFECYFEGRNSNFRKGQAG